MVHSWTITLMLFDRIFPYSLGPYMNRIFSIGCTTVSLSSKYVEYFLSDIFVLSNFCSLKFKAYHHIIM